MRTFEVDVWVKSSPTKRYTGLMHELVVLATDSHAVRSAVRKTFPGGEIRKVDELCGPRIVSMRVWKTQD